MARETPDPQKVPSPATDETTEDTAVEPLGVIGATGPDDLGSGSGTESEEDVETRLAYESLTRHRKARRRKKIIAASVAGGIILVAGVAWAVVGSIGSQQAQAPTLQTTPLVRSEFSESVQATGTAQPLSSVVVTPEVDGIIDEVSVAEGSTVSEGDTLLTIKNDELDRAVREAEINVRSTKAALSSAQQTYEATYAAYYTVEEVTASDVQQAQAERDSASLQLEAAQQTYDQAVSTAAKRTVTAPSSGSVVVMNAVSGAAVGSGAGSATSTGASSSGSSLIQIANLSQMSVKVQVNEVDISKISVGQAARVSFSALPGTVLDAQVTRISTVASSDAAANPYGYTGSGVVTYDVELLIPEPTDELKPGMTASVEILMQNVPDALTVPTSALATDDGATFYLYVMSDPVTQECARREVSVVAKSATTAAIEGDAAEGDLVVLDPYAVSGTGTASSDVDGSAATVGEPEVTDIDATPTGEANFPAEGSAAA